MSIFSALPASIRGYTFSSLLKMNWKGDTLVIRHINRLNSKECPRSRKVGDKRRYDQPRLRTVDHQSELCSVLGQRAFIDRHEGVEIAHDK